MPARTANALQIRRSIITMSMNIKNKDAYRLTKQLARLTGESLTTAVTEAVRERLDRVRRKRGIDLAERLLVIGCDCAARLKEPYRSIDHESMLYDEHGLPKISITCHCCDFPRSARGNVLRAGDIRYDESSSSAVNFVESAVVIDAGRDPIATRRFDDFIMTMGCRRPTSLMNSASDFNDAELLPELDF